MTKEPERLYLDLLKRSLTRALYEDNDEVVGFSHWSRKPWKRKAGTVVGGALARAGLELSRKWRYSEDARAHGRDWPARAETMVGLKRLDNVETCIRAVLQDDVPGDLVET